MVTTLNNEIAIIVDRIKKFDNQEFVIQSS
jgi:hypothetical protein